MASRSQSPSRGESALSARSGRTGIELTMTSGRSRRIASTTAAATCSGVQDPMVRGAGTPNFANIPSPVTYPGQIAEKETPVPSSSERSALVHSMRPALVAQ